MQELNHYLHAHNQKQILMVDPAVAYQSYPPYQRGAADEIFLKRDNGSFWLGVVWPGVTVFPDVSAGVFEFLSDLLKTPSSYHTLSIHLMGTVSSLETL